MEERRINHVKKHLIHHENLLDKPHKEIAEIFPKSDFWVYDTESCRHELDEELERVYAWGLGNTINDNVVYGETLEEFFTVINSLLDANLSSRRIKSEKKLEKLHQVEIFCHNLAWDLEFTKYELHGKGFKLHRDDVQGNKLDRTYQEVNTYTVVENRNIVYGSTVCLQGTMCKNTFKFYDSYKIMSKKLEDIGKEVIKVDEMFYKMGSEYDYESIRPIGHKLTLLEQQYLYNDIYILKEFIKQFYIPIGTSQKTASGIAFEFFIETKYGLGSMSKNYKAFEMDFPLIYNPMIRQIINDSYSGGLTQANKKYIGEVQKGYGLSVDINSSYPNEVKNNPLPIGYPYLIDGKPVYNKKYQNAILTIEFDGFRNNNPFDKIGKIKVLGRNSEVFGLGGNDYAFTNFKQDGLIGGNGKSENHLYKLSLWDFELEEMCKHMTFFTHKITKCKYTGNVIKGKLEKGYKIESSLMFQMKTGHFGQAVDICMKEKTLGKETGNTCLTEFAKLKMNSFYGKTGSTDERELRYIEEDEHGLLNMKSDGVTYLTDKKYYKAFASCVTARARVNLMSTLYKIGFNNVVYWDTDSLYTMVDKENLLKCGINLHPTKLGAWDIEKEYTEIKAIGAKKYIAWCKPYGKNLDYSLMCKCAGLPSDVRNTITMEDFYLGNTFKGKKVKKKVKGGYRLVSGDFHLNNTVY